MNTILITIKSIQDGFFRCKIRPVIGESYYKEFTPAAFHEYVMGIDFHCDVKGYQYKVIVPDAIKKMCGQWLENTANNYTNTSDA